MRYDDVAALLVGSLGSGGSLEVTPPAAATARQACA